MAQKPSIPSGTRDFGPVIMGKRKFILQTIEEVYRQFGFVPLETPAMEYLSVLTGKYGDEGDQLIFKILNSGDFLSKRAQSDWENYKKLTPLIAEKALRYDLTVPFARFVVMNRNDIYLPFKRYQIQPVWRGDRPQRGRYREFYQCDADIIGTDSLLCEAEISAMISLVFEKLGLRDYEIKINNRKILTGIAEASGCGGKENDLCVAIDKLDKIGKIKVLEELRQKGFSDSALDAIDPIFSFEGSNEEKLTFLKNFLRNSPTGNKGVEETEVILAMASKISPNPEKISVDIRLARGLNYYTGAIFEVEVLGVGIGSIAGGGRYDNLTGTFGMPGLSGIGISFGIDRIFDVMEELSLFPPETMISTTALICTLDEKSFESALVLLTKLRSAGINTEMYPETTKLKKQLNYANSKNIPFVIMIGSNELQSNQYTLKDMLSGEQETISEESLIRKLKS